MQRNMPGNAIKLFTCLATCSAVIALSGCRTLTSWVGGVDSPDAPSSTSGSAGPTTTYTVGTDADAVQVTQTRIETNYTQSQTALPTPMLQPTRRPIVAGPLPLVYLVESPGQLLVREVAGGQVVARFSARSSQIVLVDAKGVVLANQRLTTTPLDGANYAIELVADDDNVVRQTITQPQLAAPAVEQAPPPMTEMPVTASPASDATPK